ncbi:MAG TPA: BTAD domain-containing putative transcriptional regulator [Gaiellaceae bacterium]
MRFRILGPLEVEGPSGTIPLAGAKQRVLLMLLLLRANDVVPTGTLIELLWPEEPPADAAKALQVQVSRLRRALEADVLRTLPGGYLLDVDPGEFDLRRFEELAAAGRELLAQGDAAAARGTLNEALELWRGTPLAEFAANPLARREAGRLEELRLTALEDRIDADLALGAHGQLVGELEALVARHPLRERLRAQLMLALYRAGRQADALAAYRDARHALVDELGIEPGRQLQDLEQSILRQDTALDLPVSSSTRPGRRAAGIFVGRERELDDLDPALEDAAAGRGRLFLVSGDSGVGKTRLADELASRAKDAGARVLWGRCSKRAGAPPYWPWMQALQSLEDVPDLDPTLGDEERFRLFVELGSRLRKSSSRQPVLLVFDDLQYGDELSLLLLEFVAGELAVMHVAIVATYVESSDMPDALAALADHSAHHRLRLQPLGVEDVARFLELTGAADVDAAELHADTGGNPRLVWQKVR